MRVSHLAAMATLVALLGAMFVAPGTRAAVGDAVGDVSATVGYCVDPNPSPDSTKDAVMRQLGNDGLGDANGTIIQVYHPDDTNDTNSGTAGIQGDADSKPDPMNLACADANHGQKYSISPTTTTTPIMTYLAPTLELRITNDSDNLVKGGQDVMVTATYKHNHLGVPSPRVEWLRVSGTLDGTEDEFDSGAAREIIVPAGTSAGEYTISAQTVSHDHDGDSGDGTGGTTANRKISASPLTFTVGDAGVNAASATLTLGNENPDLPGTEANEAKPESGTTGAGGDIWLVLQVKNTSGAKANAAGLNTVTIIAPGAGLAAYQPDAAGNPSTTSITGTHVTGGVNSLSVGETAATDDADVVGNTMFIKVTKAGSPPKPGSVVAYALVIGTDGAPRSEDVPLTFSGSSSTLELGDAKALAAGGKTEFSVKAMDAGGNTAGVSQLSIVVRDSDGKVVPSAKLKAEKSTVGASTDTKADDNPNAVAVLVTAGSGASAPTPGTYTVDVSLPSVANSKVSASVTVSGKAHTIEAMSEQEDQNINIGGIVRVNAEISDEGGSPVADDTEILFTAAGSGTLVGLGTSLDDNDAAIIVKSKDGKASARFYVSKGAGVTSVIVTVHDGDNDAHDVVKFTIAGTEEEAMPEEEASVSCLSELSGFATWSCGVSADASEIFEMVSARGVSAIHLWNGSTWVRYSVVDDAMVPGSSDFMVTENDILYISN